METVSRWVCEASSPVQHVPLVARQKMILLMLISIYREPLLNNALWISTPPSEPVVDRGEAVSLLIPRITTLDQVPPITP